MKRTDITKEKLIDLYCNHPNSTRDIAKILDCGQTTIRRKLKKFGISSKTLDNKEWREVVNKKISENESEYEIEKELLESLYWGNQLSTIQITNLFNCSECVIRTRLKRYNIPTRSISEARKGNVYENTYKFPKGGIPWNKGIPWDEETLKKMSDAGKGRKGYWTGKVRLDMRGEKNPRWNGGFNLENNQIRQSNEYNKWRKLVYKRDNYICKLCGVTDCEVVAHHIKSFNEYPDLRFDVSNGITLCRSCHSKIHHSREYICKI